MPQFHFQQPHFQPSEVRELFQSPAIPTRWAPVGPRLVGGTAFTSRPALDALQVQALAQATLVSLDAARQVILAWQRTGHTLEAIYIQGIAPCARYLGAGWSSDRLDFATVTIATSHLQRLMYECSATCLQEGGVQPNGMSLLLLTEPGAQHSLGLFMLSEFFKRAGWDVAVGLPQDVAEFKRLFRADWFDAVGISLSTDRHLDTLERLIPELKAASVNLDMHIFVGGPMVMRDPHGLNWLFAEVLAEDAPVTVEKVTQSLACRVV